MASVPKHYEFGQLLFPGEHAGFLDVVKNYKDTSDAAYTHELGRLNIEGLKLPTETLDRITRLVNQLLDPPQPLEMVTPPLCVIYSAEYGDPRLPPHFDGDFTDFIIDYQLDSSTTWPLGADLSVYPLKDNSAVGFNPNKTIHWRPEKQFQPGEYVTMIFFRFVNSENPSDNSHLPHHPDDEVFKEVAAFRDSYKG